MILADTSVWVDHLRVGEPRLALLLVQERIVVHPFVISEIALGSLRDRDRVLGLLDGLPHAPVADAQEIRGLIERRRLHGRGVGFVDVALLASCLLSPSLALWTRDQRLDATARELGFGIDGEGEGA